jgi:hypothetical protein
VDCETFLTVGGAPLGSLFFLVLASVLPSLIKQTEMADLGRSSAEEPGIWGSFFLPAPLFDVFELTFVILAANRGSEAPFFFSVASIGAPFSAMRAGGCGGPGPVRLETADTVAAT